MEASILWGIPDYMKDHVYVLWLTVQTEVQVNSQKNKLKYLHMITLPNSQIIPFLLSLSCGALSERLVYRIYEYNKNSGIGILNCYNLLCSNRNCNKHHFEDGVIFLYINQ